MLQWPKYCGRALSVSCVQLVQPWPSRPISGNSPSLSSHSQPGHWVDQGELLWEQARMARVTAPVPKGARALKPSEARVHALCFIVLLFLTVVYYRVTTTIIQDSFCALKNPLCTIYNASFPIPPTSNLWQL